MIQKKKKKDWKLGKYWLVLNWEWVWLPNPKISQENLFKIIMIKFPNVQYKNHISIYIIVSMSINIIKWKLISFITPVLHTMYTSHPLPLLILPDMHLYSCKITKFVPFSHDRRTKSWRSYHVTWGNSSWWQNLLCCCCLSTVNKINQPWYNYISCQSRCKSTYIYAW